MTLAEWWADQEPQLSRLVRITLGIQATDMFTTDQTHSRFFNDDGSESAATGIAAEDTDPVSIDVDVTKRIRICVQNTKAIAGTEQMRFQYNLLGAGWNQITTTSSVVKAVASADTSWTINDGDATTDRIGGTGTFQAGEMIEDGDANSATSFGASEHSEYELVFQVVSTDVVNNDTIDIRIVNTMNQVLDNYSHTPTITVVEAGVTVVTGNAEAVAQSAATPEQTHALTGGVEAVAVAVGTAVVTSEAAGILAHFATMM